MIVSMANSNEADKWDVVEKIGHGSFGIIHKVKRKSDQEILCRKEVNYLRMTTREKEQLQAELSILSSLKHPNIVQYYHRDHRKSNQELHIYMEYCGGGDLSKVIKGLASKRQFAEEEYVWAILAQLVTALYRCHYGVDPPDVGQNFMGRKNSAKPVGLKTKNQIMILHRDLKPENVFLGEDNSVKLGDFGLSKLMQSNDFASTYVGTPYYMSPEICVGERYTHCSDIWSLGCIMYELCAGRVPFDANSHIQLAQKIKTGKFDPLPKIYSAELQDVITSCLRVNPLRRPDTGMILDLPMVKLMRREREMITVGIVMKDRERVAQQKIEEAAAYMAGVEAEKMRARAEIESLVRREWEVKARLEIDRQVNIGMERLQKQFESEFASRVQLEVENQIRSLAPSQVPRGTHSSTDIPLSSISETGDTSFPSITDMTSLSLSSSTYASTQDKALAKPTRTPFTRARTQYDSPMDVHMASPSPMSIASLSLSPRRQHASTLPNSQNIFVAAAAQRAKWEPHLLSPAMSDSEAEDADDEIPELPSPTRPRPRLSRPGMPRQQSMPLNRTNHNAQPTLFSKQTVPHSPPPAKPGAGSPRRGSNFATLHEPGSPTLRPVSKQQQHPYRGNRIAGEGGDTMVKAVLSKNMAAGVGRTLVELAQARDGSGENTNPGGQVARKVDSERRDAEVAVWDWEKDEMPSPFLARKGRMTTGLYGR